MPSTNASLTIAYASLLLLGSGCYDPSVVEGLSCREDYECGDLECVIPEGRFKGECSEPGSGESASETSSSTTESSDDDGSSETEGDPPNTPPMIEEIENIHLEKVRGNETVDILDLWELAHDAETADGSLEFDSEKYGVMTNAVNCWVAENRFFRCTISSQMEGREDYEVSVMDEGGYSADDKFSVYVINEPPVWTPIPDIALPVAEDPHEEFLDMFGWVEDPDEADDDVALSFNMEENNFNVADCWISGDRYLNCRAKSAGTNTVTLRASDGMDSTETTVKINVSE